MRQREPYETRKRLLERKAALWAERSSWEAHWREISTYQQPRAGRFSATDRNEGGKRMHKIVDNTAIFASRTLAAGLMSGMTSPARPWFALRIDDQDLMESAAVKTWLHKTTALLRAIFASSNTYRALHSLYEELGLFGTAASLVLPDYDNVIHHYPLTIGEYAIAAGAKGNVDTLAREFQMTVGQMVEEFGLDACSSTVRRLWDRGALDEWVTVVHLVYPRKDRDVTRKDARNMPFASCYLEPASDNTDKLLRESGFKRFRALCPRWQVTGRDVYGTSPGMECLGDVKQLQHQQMRKAEAIDYQVRPPLQVPVQYKHQALNRLPGGVMYVDQVGAAGGIRSAFEVNLRLDYLLADIQDVRDRIKSAYYADLFLMMANDSRSGVTATEIAERHEEKLLALGPVLERLHNELLAPLIDIAFDDAAAAGILPAPPAELAGRDLQVEFVSVLAQAQRAVANQSIERFVATVGQLAGAKPEVLDKIDFDRVVDDLRDGYGINPEIVVPTEVAQRVRAERAAAMQAQAAAATAPQVVESAKTASEIDIGNLREVQDVMSALTGYGTGGPQPVR